MELAHRLKTEQVEADEIALLYYTCALRGLQARAKSAGEEFP